MRNIQEIFNEVIARRLYTNGAEDYMCNSLFLAKTNKHVTNKEYVLAQREINNYLDGLQPNSDDPLYATLLETAYPCEDGAFALANHIRREIDILRGRHGIVMDIYRNWDNRPKTAEEVRAIFDSILNQNNDE